MSSLKQALESEHCYWKKKKKKEYEATPWNDGRTRCKAFVLASASCTAGKQTRKEEIRARKKKKRDCAASAQQPDT